MEARPERVLASHYFGWTSQVCLFSRFQVIVARLIPLLVFSLLLLSGTGAAQQHEADPLDRHNSAAQTFQLAGDLDRAETEYHEVLALALQRMGNLAATEKSDSEEAVSLLEQSMQAQTANPDASVDLATLYFQRQGMNK